MKIDRSNIPQEQAGRALSNLLRANAHKPILLMVSGGSAFSILEYVEDEVLSNRIALCVLDERYSKDPAINNFAQLQQTEFFIRCAHARVDFISTKVGDDESLEDVAVFWESSLRMWKAENPDCFVVATMGIGTDGHTAGIFPGTPAADYEGESWVVAYEVLPDINQHTQRITVTNTFLKEYVDEFVTYAVGADKQKYVEMLESGSCAQPTPACVMLSMKSGTLFTDLKRSS